MKTNAYLNVPATTRRMDSNQAGERRRFASLNALVIAAVLVAGSAGAIAQEEPAATAPAAPANAAVQPEAVAPAETTPQVQAAEAAPAQEQPRQTNRRGSQRPAPAAQDESSTTTGTGGEDGLNINFKNAPLEQALNYLADAAGFIVQMAIQPQGVVNLRGQNLTREEVLLLVTSELNRNGYAAERRGRTLKIVQRSEARAPVRIGSNAQDVPDNDEVVTQIIPIRFVEAQQLVASDFLSPQAKVIANQAGNSVIITDTSSNIRHLLEVISAIDSSAEDITEVRTFRLAYADPNEMAALLTSLFPEQGGTANPMRFNRGGRGNRGGGNNFFAQMAAARCK
jgi:hypothetical protein